MDGTPVLDIKPYVTPYDSLPLATVPSWCGIMPSTLRVTNTPGVAKPLDNTPGVEYADGTDKLIDEAAANGKLKFYTQGVDVRQAIRELLVSDVRPDSSYRRWKPAGE